MKVNLPYGKGCVEIEVPDGSTVAYPHELPRVPDVGAEIRRAMAAPIGCPPLRAIASGKRDAAVIINDITRPAPSREMLAAILEELRVAGIPETAVTVIIATGNHRLNSPGEIAQMIGHEFARRLRVVNHACEEDGALTAVSAPGVSIPVRVNSHVAKNYRGEVVHAVAGDLEAAHEAGVQVCEQSWVVTFPQKYDIVVVTPGGYPRDIDLHQAQKAMSTAELVAADGGVIVLLAECADGIGKFAEWLKTARSPQDVIERFKREGFTREHSSKAFMCARALAERCVVVSCSGIRREDLEAMFFRCAQSPQDAVDMALRLKGDAGSVLILPYAVDCVPKVLSS